MNYATLISELRDDPAGIGYAGMSDQQAADAINASTQAARKLVPLWQIKKRLVETGTLLAIQAAASVESPVQAAAALTLEYIDDRRFENLDMDLDSTKMMVGGLVSGGVVSAELAAELDGMAETTTSRAAILGLGVVGDGHILSARSQL